MKPTIIVTGTSRGLGEAIGKCAARLGARVVLNARSKLDLARIEGEIPGRTLAILALYAPSDWSGDFLSWDDDRVQELVLRYS